MGFPRQEYWSGLPFPTPGIKRECLASLALAGSFFTTRATWEVDRWAEWWGNNPFRIITGDTKNISYSPEFNLLYFKLLFLKKSMLLFGSIVDLKCVNFRCAAK